MAWSDAARAAALQARRLHAKSKVSATAFHTLRPFAKAKLESRKGYVQHVEFSKGRLRQSDWYDHGNTLASYEGGRVLYSNPSMNNILRGIGRRSK